MNSSGTSSQTRSQQHRNLKSVRWEGVQQAKLFWHLCLCLLRVVWHLFHPLIFVFSFLHYCICLMLETSSTHPPALCSPQPAESHDWVFLSRPCVSSIGSQLDYVKCFGFCMLRFGAVQINLNWRYSVIISIWQLQSIHDMSLKWNEYLFNLIN